MAHLKFFQRWSGVVQIILVSCSTALGQELTCTDVNPEGGPLGYMQRAGDLRCEGFYRSPVAGIALELLSLTSGQIDIQLQPAGTLYITGPDIAALKADKFRLQARALPLNTYYRMDAISQSGGRFRWPMSSLYSANLTSDQIGVLGWLDQRGTKMYLPISLSDGTSSAVNRGTLIAVLRSSVDVEKLFWRTWPAAQQAAPTSGWETTNSAYRAGQPIRVELHAGSGATFVEFNGKMARSDDWASFVAQVYQP